MCYIQDAVIECYLVGETVRLIAARRSKNGSCWRIRASELPLEKGSKGKVELLGKVNTEDLKDATRIKYRWMVWVDNANGVMMAGRNQGTLLHERGLYSLLNK